MRFVRNVAVFALVAAACSGSSVETASTTSSTTTEAPVISDGATSTTTTTTATTAAAPITTTHPTTTTSTSLVLGPADAVYRNVTILTMDPVAERAEMVAVADGMIVAVGSETDVGRYIGDSTAVLDLGGATLMPGFVDAHTHLLNDIGPIEGQRIAAENGITTLGNLFSTADFIATMQDIDAAGQLQIRTSLYLPAIDPCGAFYGDWWHDFEPSFEPGEMLRIQGVKVFTDGGACGNPAISQPFPLIDGLGDLWMSQDQLDGIVVDADARGFQVVMHAIGDRAIDQALEAMSILVADGDNERRHRIDHNSIMRPDQVPLYGEYDVTTVLFGYHSCVTAERSEFYHEAEWPWRALLDANPGLDVAWHGDDPWVGPVSPLLELRSLVTRHAVDGDGNPCEPPDWLASHALTAEESLAMMTTGAAYALFRDTEVGSITPGKYADFVVLSDNPLDIDPLDLEDVRVLATIVGGEAIYCAEDAPVCPGGATEPGTPSPTPVTGLRLWVDQAPAGRSVHRVLGGPDPDPTEELAVLEGDTTWGDILEATGSWTVRYLRIETVESPSWVAWLEVEVLLAR